ncbi:hypothetical protein TUMEXPCC7403_14230 [Tumidithrix helvetica PCC 7403]|uniref:PAS domain S-box protein n=1 Tax=Tumidithrix helvetica TaxID=3457545 RepID=UPI003CA6D299
MRVISPDRFTILIVEDNPINLSVLYEALTDVGYQLQINTDGRNVVPQTQQNPPDLILLDVMLPEIDGFEICRQLKANSSTQAIPVIFMTALIELKDKVTGLSLGAVDYITKPFQIAELLARLQLHLQLSHLSKTLEEKNLELQSLTQELEERVMERTAELLESQQRYQALMNGASDAILLADVQGNLLHVNKKAEQMFGYTRNELTQMHLSQLHPPEALIESKAYLSDFRQGVTDLLLSSTALRKDGSYIPIEITSSLIEVGEERIIQGIFRDVTERRRVELENQILQHRMQFILSFSPAVIYACSPEGNYKVTFVSENILEVMGYTPENFIQDADFWASHIHPEDTSKFFAGYANLLEQGEHTHKYRFLHKNGKYCWIRDEMRLVRDHYDAPFEIIGCFFEF